MTQNSTQPLNEKEAFKLLTLAIFKRCLSLFILAFSIAILLNLLGGCGDQFNKESNCTFNGDNCDDGKPDPSPVPGPKGDPGPRGAEGRPGKDGAGCSVLDAENGALITCDKVTVLILDGTNGNHGVNGVDGQNGQDGEDGQDAVQTPFTVTELLDPCGDNPNQFDEVLLRLANNDLIAYFEQGNKRFLTVIPPGNYVTTDTQACSFTVNNDRSVTW